MRRVGVFCGSSAGVADPYVSATERFADALVAAGLGLVYGGASVGLMGVLADRVLVGGGDVIGVIPKALEWGEIAHGGGDLREVDSLAERKALMASLSDAFVALPGGLGTLDELFEMLTWTQLGLHDKPAGLLDVDGFWSDLVAFLDRVRTDGFVHRRFTLYVDDDPAALLRSLSG